MSLSCGFAMNSTIPEVHQMPSPSRRGIRISPAWRLACGWSAHHLGVAVIAMVAICGPLVCLIAALRLHLPSGSEAFWVLLALSDETR